MKHFFLFIVMFTFSLTSFASAKADAKVLVLYYSRTGTTEHAAQVLQRELKADIEAIKLQNPYHGTYEEIVERVGKERQSGDLPTLIPLQSDLSRYDVIFLGYPIWYGTYASPVAALTRDYDFKGKRIVTFCTFGSGGLEAAIQDLKKALPEAEVADNGFGIRTARMVSAPKELRRFLVELNYLEGSIEALPDYSELQAVTQEEKRIFEEACGDYQYPLGIPVSVGKRTTSEGVDYVFKSDCNGAIFTIYVTVENKPGARAEFTRVVR